MQLPPQANLSCEAWRVYDAALPAGPHPVAIVTRDTAIPVLSNVTVVMVTSTIRGLRTEVALGTEHGLKQACVANCDNVFTIPKSALTRHRGALDPAAVETLATALRIAFALD